MRSPTREPWPGAFEILTPGRVQRIINRYNFALEDGEPSWAHISPEARKKFFEERFYFKENGHLSERLEENYRRPDEDDYCPHRAKFIDSLIRKLKNRAD